MRTEPWGDLSGSIYHQTLILRGKSLWTAPLGAASSAIRPIITFQPKQTSGWNFHYNALTSDGKVSFQVEAVNRPWFGYPRFHGAIQADNGLTADIICSNEPSRILSIQTKSPDLHVTAEKITSRSRNSDMLFAEAAAGDLAKILRQGYEESFKEQAAVLLGMRPWRRGAFYEKNPIPSAAGDYPIRICVLVAMCIYFYQLEPLYNTDGSFG